MLDGYAYTYNLQGDVASKQNLALDAYNAANNPASPLYLDETYTNDLKDQLTLAHPRASSTRRPIRSWPARPTSPELDLDGLGNWSNYTVQQGTAAASRPRWTRAEHPRRQRDAEFHDVHRHGLGPACARRRHNGRRQHDDHAAARQRGGGPDLPVRRLEPFDQRRQGHDQCLVLL